MSSTTGDQTERLNLAEQVTRIERAIVENQRFVAGQRKLMAEAAKLERDTRLAPWLAGGAVAGGILTAATLLFRALGVL